MSSLETRAAIISANPRGTPADFLTLPLYDSRIPVDGITPYNLSERAVDLNSRLAPPNPECEVVVVIPVYKEFEHGRIRELLDELSRQTLDSQKFEVLLVVNNPRRADSARSGSPISQGYIDNLKLLEYLGQEKAKGKYSNIQAIDCTDGRVPRFHYGMARAVGNEVASLRFEETKVGENGVLVQLDADTSVDHDFLDSILEIYHQDPDLQSVAIQRMPLPIDYTSDDMYLGYANDFIASVVAMIQDSKAPEVSGTTVSFRAYLQKSPEIRMYAHDPINADYHLGESLYALTSFGFLLNLEFIRETEKDPKDLMPEPGICFLV